MTRKTVRRAFRKVRVIVRVLKRKRVEVTMGSLRTIACRAGGFPATKGMTDVKARLGRSHGFEIGKQHLLTRFLADVRLMVRRGEIRVSLNGRVHEPA